MSSTTPPRSNDHYPEEPSCLSSPNNPSRSVEGVALSVMSPPSSPRLTDDVLFEDVWNRPELAARDRSLITVAALVAGGDVTTPLPPRPRPQQRRERAELIEAITHLGLLRRLAQGHDRDGRRQADLRALADGQLGRKRP